MNPEPLPEPVDSTDSPAPARPSLDPSEEEALFQHLRRYRAHEGRRRQGRMLLAAAMVIAGGALLVVVATLATRTRPEASRPETSAPVIASVERGEMQGRAEPQPPGAEAPAEARAARLDAPPEPPPLHVERLAGRQVAAPPVTTGAPSPATATERAVPTVASPPPSSRDVATVPYQPRERLAAVSAGDPKERVFDRFATTFEERNGAVLRIDGMRWRASGRSPRHAQVEVADVVLADAGTGRVHWFLFGDGRLLAWGRPEEWPAAARHHEIEIDYRPAAPTARAN